MRGGMAGATAFFALCVWTCGAQTLCVAYVGFAHIYYRGFRTFAAKIDSVGGLRIGRGTQIFNITHIEHFASSPDEYRVAFNAAAAEGADVVIAGTHTANRIVSELGEAHGIPSIHCSGGNPALWRAAEPHSFGMHVPFTFYSKGAVAAGRISGMRSMTILRSGGRAFWSASGVAALEWARLNDFRVVGPTLRWCRTYANLTATCRIVRRPSGDKCVCGEQAEASELSYDRLSFEDFPGIYEIHEGSVAGPGFDGGDPEIRMSVVSFFEGIIEDIRSQGVDPDVVVCFTTAAKSTFYAAHRTDFNAKMWVGFPYSGDGTVGVNIAHATMNGTQVVGASHAMFLVGGMQWHIGLKTTDALFGSNAEYAAFYRRLEGADPNYNEAGCSAAGSTLFAALDKYARFLDVADAAQRRGEIRGALADMNDPTIYGLIRFNKAGQSMGHAGVTTQFQKVGGGGRLRVVLPGDVAEAALSVPMPTWASKLGCPAGQRNTGRNCEDCEPGKFGASTTLALTPTWCMQCPKGFGTAPAAFGSVNCSRCPPGRAQDGALHLGVCHRCQRGTFRNASMPSDTCLPCSSSSFADEEGLEACLSCPAGTYQAERGQTACICKTGWYRSDNATRSEPCLPCQAVISSSTTRYSASISSQECTCDRGWYLRGGACHECQEDFPEGSVECGGFGSPPMLRRGWMTQQGKATVYLCPRRGDGCPGGVAVGVESCAEGGSDLACAWCAAGYRYNSQLGRCVACEGGSYVIWMLCAIFSVALFFLMRPLTLRYDQDTVRKMIRKSFYIVTCSQIIDMLQVCAIFGSSALSWSRDEEQAFFTIGGVFSLSTISPMCFLEGSRADLAFKYVLLVNLCPAIIILFIALCAMPSVAFPAIRKSHRIPDTVTAANLSLGLIISFFITILHLALNIVFASYAHPKTGEHSLLSFPYILSSAEEAVSLVAVAVASVCVWCVGTISFVIFVQWYLHFKRPSFAVRLHTMCLVVRHRHGASWWMVFEMAQKSFVAMSVAIFHQPAEQMQLMCVVFVLYAVALAHVKPYRYLRHTVSDMILTLLKVGILITSVRSIQSQEPTDDGIVPTLLLLAALVTGVVMLSWCCFRLCFGTDALDEEKLLRLFERSGRLSRSSSDGGEMTARQSEQIAAEVMGDEPAFDECSSMSGQQRTESEEPSGNAEMLVPGDEDDHHAPGGVRREQFAREPMCVSTAVQCEHDDAFMPLHSGTQERARVSTGVQCDETFALACGDSESEFGI